MIKPKSEYAYSAKQRKVLRNAHCRWNILYGATRSGKSKVSYSTALLHIAEHYTDNILFAGKTINTLDRNVFEEMRKDFGEWNIGKIVDKKEITIFGKRCYCVGANDDRAITKIQGLGIGYAYLDELTTYPENFFNMLKSRLDAPNACCDATCNPEAPSHFVKQFIDKISKDKPEDMYAEHFTIYDNPFLDPKFVASLETEYRGTIYFDKWILGKWVKSEGLVFPLFRRERHYMKPERFAELYGKHRIVRVIWGGDGATTNDATAIIPLAIMDNGQGVVLEPFYHNPKINGQLSNEQLMPYIHKYIDDMEKEYKFMRNGTEFCMAIDCAASDLVITLAYHLPNYFNVHKYTKKDIQLTTDIVNNAFSRNALVVLDFGGYYNYFRGQFVQGDMQLVIDLESMTWDEANPLKYDPKVPNDCADAFRYAVCTYYINPDNLWDTPEMRIYGGG